MAYDVPGGSDSVGDKLVDRWNEKISAAYDARSDLHTRFFTLDPGDVKQPQVTDGVEWPADPHEPTFCVDEQTVRTLSDWGSCGRHALHNEYCEYAVVYRDDSGGRLRPKRVQVTTELREYWLMLAVHDPERLLVVAEEVLGDKPSWTDLYGAPDPHVLSEDERRVGFARTMAGHGGDRALACAGVPANPAGRLNRENAVFMTHPINGLDDLIFIVLFGARRYAVKEPGGGFRRAASNDIFAAAGQRELACRHADPAAAMGAYSQVMDARMLSFANPLGIYLRPLNRELFKVGDEDIPDEWVRETRGGPGMRQRLEFGPGDDDDAFLDDIDVHVGGDRQRMTGGHQLLRQLNVGPLIATGATEPATESEFEVIPDAAPIECGQTGICDIVGALEREHKLARLPKPGPRRPAVA
jgi:hypothetical protein